MIISIMNVVYKLPLCVLVRGACRVYFGLAKATASTVLNVYSILPSTVVVVRKESSGDVEIIRYLDSGVWSI